MSASKPVVPEKFLYFTNARETWWPALVFDNYTQLHEILTNYNVRGFSDVRNRSFIDFVERRALNQRTNDIAVAILLGSNKEILWGDDIPLTKNMIKSVELMTEYSGNNVDWDDALAEAMKFVTKFRLIARALAKGENCGESFSGFTVLSEENLVLNHDNVDSEHLPNYVSPLQRRSRRYMSKINEQRKLEEEMADDLIPFPRLDKRNLSDSGMARYKRAAVVDDDDTVASGMTDPAFDIDDGDVSRVEKVLASGLEEYCVLPSCCGLWGPKDSAKQQHGTCGNVHSCSFGTCGSCSVCCTTHKKEEKNLIEDVPKSSESKQETGTPVTPATPASPQESEAAPTASEGNRPETSKAVVVVSPQKEKALIPSEEKPLKSSEAIMTVDLKNQLPLHVLPAVLPLVPQ
mmetsp:Transcript_13850/g.20434  ORF Transcript_13850/g.20434 Transcript_13850/m.20434 type:complete len:405 (-) Transcript_13850:53-1267(-)|eukprot:CAMPEP_0194211786 /NCGR_PEP_ID=MMETSP0156-20130528/11166_1 /TAXON_ID=33649 /ORGANISM="Thalassionema nitzschioides, Strain L26-B" /LENGTH=404 /DNA_ID=CAMNT_0038939443 /DNA_START=32 /DNA_END=1243 /DNA_ORIENTATION=+